LDFLRREPSTAFDLSKLEIERVLELFKVGRDFGSIDEIVYLELVVVVAVVLV
jgi:hypothetical protein